MEELSPDPTGYIRKAVHSASFVRQDYAEVDGWRLGPILCDIHSDSQNVRGKLVRDFVDAFLGRKSGGHRAPDSRIAAKAFTQGRIGGPGQR
jgi:hypothetical protein